MTTVSLKRRWIRSGACAAQLKGVSWSTQYPLVGMVKGQQQLWEQSKGEYWKSLSSAIRDPPSWWGAACKSWFAIKWVKTVYPNVLGVWVREFEIQMWKELLVTDFLKWSESKTSNSTAPWILRDLKSRPEPFDVSSHFSALVVRKSRRRKAGRPLLAAHTATEDQLPVKEWVLNWGWNWKG